MAPSIQASPTTTSTIRYQEMSPEVALVEFISTSASFHGVKRQAIKDLEWDILKVFPTNIMPANAAAWFMAKRRFYSNGNYDNQLLTLLLKNYPKKFAVHGHTVEFLEQYEKEIAKRKMFQMIRQGLVAYFTHKVEEYGVYFFDPFYYETVEPFHANLRQVMARAGNVPRSKLLPRFFSMHKNQFVYQVHSPYLVTISREPVEVRTNTIGVIVCMIDNEFGIIQFRCGSSTEKAFFSARCLFRDGYNYEGDPMRLPPMEFDGYRVPLLSSKSKDGNSTSFTWHAVLVWCGRKPNPKFCATKEDLISSPYFLGQISVGTSTQNGCVSFEELVSKSPRMSMFASSNNGCMQVGEVLDIKRNGAIVSLGKDSSEKAFIPGWSHRNIKIPGIFLTTTQGVELAVKDVITFCLDPNQEIGDFKAIGCNVTVLKHATEKKSNNRGIVGAHGVFSVAQIGDGDTHMKSQFGSFEEPNEERKTKTKGRKNRKSSSSDMAEAVNAAKPKGKATKTSKVKVAKKSSKLKASSPVRPKRPVFNYKLFLMKDEIDEEDNYDSEEDPSFLPPPSHDPELDYDEYSDGEVRDEEKDLLIKESIDELPILELKDKLESVKLTEIKEDMNENKV